MQTAVDVAIIGAGFAGLAAAVRLKEQGNKSFVIVERANEIGGTWRENIYPGCTCDIPSHLYSFSFAQNPGWSRTYATQPEILDYLKQVVNQYELASSIRFNTEILRTEFSTATGRWTLTDRAGRAMTARVVILAVGPLNRPAIPKLSGLDTFAGKTFHSAQWDYSYDLAQKRVAVIGTGASAIQFIPQIAPIVDQLTIFQRTAPYVMSRGDRAISATELALFRHLPLAQKMYRSWIYWRNELNGLSFLGHELFNQIGTERAKKHLERSIKDPVLRQKVTPNYKLGCKRVLISDDYYPALTRSNVVLETNGIAEIKPHSIVDKDGIERPIDAIIFGTGFMVSGMIGRMQIVGRYGQNLFDQWISQGAEAYHGTTISGFPNLLFLTGPNTGIGHNSIIHMIESQVNYAIDYLQQLDKTGKNTFLDVKPDAQKHYNVMIQQKTAKTVWASGCRSWYLDSKNQNRSIWPGLTLDYRKATRRVSVTDYDIVPCRQPSPSMAC